MKILFSKLLNRLRYIRQEGPSLPVLPHGDILGKRESFSIQICMHQNRHIAIIPSQGRGQQPVPGCGEGFMSITNSDEESL